MFPEKAIKFRTKSDRRNLLRPVIPSEAEGPCVSPPDSEIFYDYQRIAWVIPCHQAGCPILARSLRKSGIPQNQTEETLIGRWGQSKKTL